MVQYFFRKNPHYQIVMQVTFSQYLSENQMHISLHVDVFVNNLCYNPSKWLTLNTDFFLRFIS